MAVKAVKRKRIYDYARKGVSIKSMPVWTLATHGSFMTFGRPEYYPMMTIVETEGPYDLGKGFRGYLVTAPNGKTFVAEATTGAFIQDTIKAAQADIKACTDKRFMQKQVVDDAAKLLANARKPGAANALEIISPEEFWAKLKCTAVKRNDKKDRSKRSI